MHARSTDSVYNAKPGLPSNSHNKAQPNRQKNIHRHDRERIQDTRQQPQDLLQAQKALIRFKKYAEVIS